MFGFSFGEILVIFVVALIVFGPRRLPEIGRMIGKAMAEFKKASDELKSTIEREVHVEEIKSLAPPPPAETTVARAEPAPAAIEHPTPADPVEAHSAVE